MDDKTKKTSQNEDYEDNSNLKELMDDAFFIDYLVMQTIDKDREQTKEQEEEKKKENQEIIISKMLEKVVAMDNNLSIKDIKDIIGEKYAVIRYRNQASIKEVQKIFSQSIDEYLTKVKNNIGGKNLG